MCALRDLNATEIPGSEPVRIGGQTKRSIVYNGSMVLLMIWRPRGLIGHRAPTVFLEQRQAIGADITFGEMDPVAKDQISHRALAFAKLKAALL